MADSILFLICLFGIGVIVFCDFRSHGVPNDGKPFWLFRPPEVKAKSKPETSRKSRGRRKKRDK